MNRSLPLVALCLVVLLPGVALGAQTEEERLEKALEKARAQLGQEKQALAADRGAFDKTENRLRREIEGLISECEDLNREIESTRREADDAAGALERAQRYRDQSVARRAESTDVLVKRMEVLEGKTELAIPHPTRRERLAELRALLAEARDGHMALSDLARAYFDAALAEIALGSSVTLSRMTVQGDDGKEVDADVLRVGKVFGAWSAQGADRCGLLLKTGGESEGYRFAEGAEARPVMDAVTAGDAGLVLAPLDVTLDVSADRLTVARDLLATVLAGGVVMIPIGLVALAGLLLILERSVVLFFSRPRTGKIETRVLEPLRRGDVDKARSACAAIAGPAARALLDGLDARDRGRKAIEESIEEAAARALPRLERFLGGIAALAAAAPLLGLLGTVTGMIATFDVITVFGTGDPRLLSGGISEALITTQMGLVIAIPLLLVHRVLSGRVESTIAAIQLMGVSLLNALERGGQHARSGDGDPAPPVSPPEPAPENPATGEAAP